MLAGHTHCGQVAPPLIGPLSTMSEYGRRYACGLVREGGRTLVVTAGLGTSGIPFAAGRGADMWLVEVVQTSRRALSRRTGRSREERSKPYPYAFERPPFPASESPTKRPERSPP